MADKEFAVSRHIRVFQEGARVLTPKWEEPCLTSRFLVVRSSVVCPSLRQRWRVPHSPAAALMVARLPPVLAPMAARSSSACPPRPSTSTPSSTRAPMRPRSSGACATPSSTTTSTSPRSFPSSPPSGRSPTTASPTPSPSVTTPSSRLASTRRAAPSSPRTSSTPSSAPRLSPR